MLDRTTPRYGSPPKHLPDTRVVSTVQDRDLSRDEPWARSLARSRARREAAAASTGLPVLPARGVSVAAAVALTAGAAAGVTAIEAGAPDTAEAVVVKSRGADVRQLQQAIGVGADGVFGPATERALKRWQRAHGLTADGIAGPNTRAALGIGAGPVLKRKRGATVRRSRAGRSGGHRRAHGGGGVRSLQRRLGVPADGVFGPGTEAALKRWQSSHGLTARRRRRPQHAPGARDGPGPRAQATRLRRRWRWALGSPEGDPLGQPDRHHAVQVRRGPPDLPRQRLRLLRLGLLRAPRRGPAAHAARLERVHVLRCSRARALHHHLRQPQPRLHVGQRTPLRHQRALGDRLALDQLRTARRRASWSATRRVSRDARARLRPVPRAASARSGGTARWTGWRRPRARRRWRPACAPGRWRSW